MAGVEAKGGKVRLVTRRHQMSESLLYNWRSTWKAAAVLNSERLTRTGGSGRTLLWSRASCATRSPLRSSTAITGACPRAGVRPDPSAGHDNVGATVAPEMSRSLLKKAKRA